MYMKLLFCFKNSFFSLLDLFSAGCFFSFDKLVVPQTRDNSILFIYLFLFVCLFIDLLIYLTALTHLTPFLGPLPEEMQKVLCAKGERP